jgi:hypothetical protein
VPRKESVEQHVRSHIDTSRLARHAEKLGEQVGLADDVMDARLHKTFDHDVGTLSQGSAVVQLPPPAGARRASPFLELMADRKSVRQAIILSEILRRPEW